MRQWEDLLANISLVEFVTIAFVAALQWYLHRVRGAGWAALAFATLGVVVVADKITMAVNPAPSVIPTIFKFLLAVLFLMPYCLFRFAGTFRAPQRSTQLVAAALTILVVASTFALKYIPTQGIAPPPGFWAFRLVVVLQWGLLFSFVTVRLWGAGAGQPTTAARRMRLLAVAVAGLDVQVILAGLGLKYSAAITIGSQALTVAMGLLFLIALMLPSFVQTWWRARDVDSFQSALRDLIASATTQELATGLLPHVCALVGASSAAFLDENDHVLAQYPPQGAPLPWAGPGAGKRDDTIVLTPRFGANHLVVRINPYMPYFGRAELRKLNELADFVGLAMDRCAWAEQEAHAKAAMIDQALHDPLTGLANRHLLMDRLSQGLAVVRRQPESLAVMFVDLDQFKLINDKINHSTGDAVLIEIARRLEGALRTSDTVARVGGDEFVVLAEVESEAAALALADRLGQDIAISVHVGGQQLSVTASIGVAVTSSGDEDPSSLIQKADAAMYVAKENGRDRTQLFNEHLRAKALEQVEFEQDLLEAIMGAQLRLKYQPIVRLSDDVVIGVEALVRWEHPERGLLEPESFVPWAEDSGLVAQLDAWVLTEASKQAAAWLKAIPGLGAFRLWVNKSGATFLRHNTLESVLEILERTGLPTTALGIEITEHVFMSDTERMRVTLEGLMAHNIAIAIDDFGTGFSSLGYLKRFPVDVVKVDRLFVGGIGSEPETSLVAAFLGMARSLGITTVAEGVELEEQRTWLTQEGCDNAQGHLFSPPMDATDVTRLLVESGGGARVMRAILGNQKDVARSELERTSTS